MTGDSSSYTEHLHPYPHSRTDTPFSGLNIRSLSKLETLCDIFVSHAVLFMFCFDFFTVNDVAIFYSLSDCNCWVRNFKNNTKINRYCLYTTFEIFIIWLRLWVFVTPKNTPPRLYLGPIQSDRTVPVSGYFEFRLKIRDQNKKILNKHSVSTWPNHGLSNYTTLRAIQSGGRSL